MNFVPNWPLLLEESFDIFVYAYDLIFPLSLSLVAKGLSHKKGFVLLRVFLSKHSNLNYTFYLFIANHLAKARREFLLGNKNYCYLHKVLLVFMDLRRKTSEGIFPVNNLAEFSQMFRRKIQTLCLKTQIKQFHIK